MKNLIIHLKAVKESNGKIYNTVSYPVKTEQDVSNALSIHIGNVNKSFTRNSK